MPETKISKEWDRSKTRKPDRARTPEAKEELKSRILDAAVQLFLQEGYSGFTMRKLASRLGYTATTIYAYFKNKDELLFAVIGHGYDLFTRYLGAAAGEGWQRLRSIGDAYLDFAFENPELYRLMFIDRPGALFDLSEEKLRPRLGLLDEAIRVTGEIPGFADLTRERRRELTEIFWSLLHGLVSLALTVPLFDESWARSRLDSLTTIATQFLLR